MKKNLILLLSLTMLLSCDFQMKTLSKYEDDNIGRFIEIAETHPMGSGKSIMRVFDDRINSVTDFNTGSGSAPTWAGVPDIDTQFSIPGVIINLQHYMDFLIQLMHYTPFEYLSFEGSGTYSRDSFGYQFNTTINYSSSKVDSVTLPYAAGIHGPSTAALDGSYLTDFGNLYKMEFSITSDNTLLSGNAMMIFHSGYPNGLLYFIYYHDTGYTTLAAQTTGGGSSGQVFSSNYTAEYDWWMFNSASDPSSVTPARTVWTISELPVR